MKEDMRSAADSALQNNKKVYKDFLWYFYGAAVPMILSFIKTPIFTRYFTPEEYGVYGLISITFYFVSVIIYSWICSCIWRYYNKFQNEKRLRELYVNIIFIYMLSSAASMVFCLIWISISKDTETNWLIILTFIQTAFNQLIALYMIIIRLQGRSKTYNIYNNIIAVFSFILLAFLTFILKYRIEAMAESYILIYIVVIAVLAVRSKISFEFRLISRSIIKEFTKYGFACSISNASLLILITSDRYIIRIYDSVDCVGIYNQIYNLAQISIEALITIFYNSINPILYSSMEKDIDSYPSTMKKYLNLYLMLILPFTVYFSLFSKQISIILLGEKFRSGYTMMPYIMITSMIYGMTEFWENKLKFSNKVIITVKGFLTASVINVVLNFILIPVFTYQVAAVTTLISYMFLFLYYYYHDSMRFFRDKENNMLLCKTFYIIAAEVVLDLILRKILRLDINAFYTIAEGSVFFIIYLMISQRWLAAYVLKWIMIVFKVNKMTNKEKYALLCEKEKSIPIFSQHWWMDAVCGEDNWDVLLVEKGCRIVGSMPYYFRKKRGYLYIEQPILTPQNGIWIRYPEDEAHFYKISYEDEIIDSIIERLEELKIGEFNQNFSNSFINWLPFFWNSFYQSTRYSYVIEDLSNVEKIYYSLSPKARQNIRKAKAKVQVKEDLNIEAFYEINKKSFERQNIKIPYSLEQLKKIDEECVRHNCRKIFYAEDNQGRIHAVLYLIWDENAAYNLMMGEDPILRDSEAGDLLTWTAIKFSSGITKEFHFEGSMIQPIERFFRKFATVQKTYFNIKKSYSVSSILMLIAKDLYRSCPRIRRFKKRFDHFFGSLK